MYKRQVLERGKVDFSLWIEKKDADQLATPINQAIVESYYRRIKEISASAGIPEPGDWFATLLRLPDVMTKNEAQELSDEEWAIVHTAVCEAINHLVDFRKQEGAALEKKFREKITNIAHLLEAVSPYEKERVVKIKERITDALEKTLSVDYDKNRLEPVSYTHLDVYKRQLDRRMHTEWVTAYPAFPTALLRHRPQTVPWSG